MTNTICPPGMIYRKSFTRKGTRVSGKCIRKTTPYDESSSNKIHRIHGRMSKRMKGVRKTKRSIQSCPKGYILRDAYMRYTEKGKHILVPNSCIVDRGAPGEGLASGPGIGPLREGDLSQYGYKDVSSLSVKNRHEALSKAVRTFGSLTVWRKLNAIYIYTRRTSPLSSTIFKADMDWIRKEFGIKAF